MPKAAKRPAASTSGDIQITVSGRCWKYVSDLANSGRRDGDFTVTQTADGETTIQFGDGVHGVRPPAGGEIAVRYHTGGGAAGNAVTVILKRRAKALTPDQPLWVVIRNRTRAISVGFVERRHRRPAKAGRSRLTS